jgi:hypothetical protein
MRRLSSLLGPEAPLADASADALLSGRLPADDAPPEYREIANLTAALTATPSLEEQAREGHAVTLMRTGLVSSSAPRRSGRTAMHGCRARRLVAACTIGATALLGGLTVAGALPGSAQSVAASVLDNLGVTVPSPNSHAGDDPADGDTTDAHTTDAHTTDAHTTDDENLDAPSVPAATGSEIADVAQTTSAAGVDKGAEISDLASDGMSQAGEHGQAFEAANAGAPPERPTPGSRGNSDPPTPPVATGSDAAQNGLGHKP